MKQQLDDNTRKSIVEYRLSRCREALREVEYLVNGGFYNSAVSRLYYACYYAAVALLIANKFETQTHAGVKTMLACHFVRTNRLDKELAKTFFELFDLRHSNDYDDFSLCDKETIEALMRPAENFIDAITILLQENQNRNDCNCPIESIDQ